MILFIIPVLQEDFIAMYNRKKLNIRIEPDLHDLLRKGAKKNLTSHVESLIVKGLITDMNELYEAAIYKGDVFRKTVEEEKILALEKRLDALEQELKYQHKLLINICILDGMTKEKVQKLASDIEGAEDYQGRLRFHNRLIAEIARTKSHTMEDITRWMKDS